MFLKKTFAIFKKFSIGLLALILFYLLSVGIAAIIRVNHQPAIPAGEPSVTIHLVSNGTHLNFYLPTRHPVIDWSLALNDSSLAQAPYIALGWGSKQFYTKVSNWSDLTPGVALKALFYDNGMIRVNRVNLPPSSYPLQRRLTLSLSQYQQLTDDILRQFTSTQPDPNYPGFYPAKGHYHPLFTCNEWSRQRLSNINIHVPVWSPFDRPILWAIE